MLNLVNKLFGSSYSRRLKSYQKIVDTINKFEPQMKSLSDSELQNKTNEFMKVLSIHNT